MRLGRGNRQKSELRNCDSKVEFIEIVLVLVRYDNENGEQKKWQLS